MLFANNQGWNTVNGVSNLMREMADREQAERFNNQKMDLLNRQQAFTEKQWNQGGYEEQQAKIRQANTQADYYSQLLPSQERQAQIDNEQKMRAEQFKAQQDYQKQMIDQYNKDRDFQASQQDQANKAELDLAKFKQGMANDRAQRAKDAQDLAIRNTQLGFEERRTAGYEQQVVNNQRGTNWYDLFAGRPNRTDVAPIKTSRPLDSLPGKPVGWFMGYGD